MTEILFDLKIELYFCSFHRVRVVSDHSLLKLIIPSLNHGHILEQLQAFDDIKHNYIRSH